MLGQAEQLLRGQFEGGAKRMIDALGSPHDDRALLLLHRVPSRSAAGLGDAPRLEAERPRVAP